ncbi:hypothetical protein BpHYR1_034298 [Brachionus plicatilis]|uniref:Uncharacterized protein n=1 Tax=Brachionus plicatilis TaxID=10195 RepID=A0A3M7RV15_BRAPC|nr:hypothetical protein BpHYR1_034298 [Brachionus plicatilis]
MSILVTFRDTEFVFEPPILKLVRALKSFFLPNKLDNSAELFFSPSSLILTLEFFHVALDCLLHSLLPKLVQLKQFEPEFGSLRLGPITGESFIDSFALESWS